MILGSPMLGNLHMINPLLPWNSTMLYPYLFLPPTAQVATGVKAPALSPWLLPSAPLWYAAVSADARASAGLFSKTVDGIEGFTWSWSQWYIIDTKYRHRCREYWNPPHPPCHSSCCPLLSLVNRKTRGSSRVEAIRLSNSAARRSASGVMVSTWFNRSWPQISLLQHAANKYIQI